MAHSRVPLGVLPGGTANVLAMEIGLGSDLDRAVDRLKKSVERRVALGRLCCTGVEPRYFLSMAGVGLDARIVNRVSADLKARAGKLAYWLAGLTHFGQSIGQFEAIVNGDPRRCGFALVSRVRNYGGDLEIASGASLAQAAATAGLSERPQWELFEEYNARNATAAFAELEWE
jgi:diacylglycerol kinase family enzyme